MSRTISVRLAGVLLIALLSLNGCSDLLEPKVFGDLTPETFFSSESDFNHAVIALYNPFTTDWGTVDQGDGTWYAALYNADPKSYLIRSMITTDEMYTWWTPHNQFSNFTWGAASKSGDFAPTYAKIRYVARATDVIDKIEKAEVNVPDNIRNRYVAEAKTLRAWLM